MLGEGGVGFGGMVVVVSGTDGGEGVGQLFRGQGEGSGFGGGVEVFEEG